MYRRITGLTGAVVLIVSAAVGAQIVGSHAARAATTSALIGAHLADSDSTRTGQTAWKESLSQFELTTGRVFDVVATRPEKFASTFPSYEETWARQTGHIPVVNWLIGFTPSVAKGTLDATLLARANAMKAYGARILLEYAPGMDAGTGGRVTSAATFVAAWQHTHDLFVAKGVTNVEWVWCPSTTAWNSAKEMQWYPGAAYVDWTCARGLATGDTAPSFGTEFRGFLSNAGGLGKPLMIGSFGVDLPTGLAEAAWIKSAFATITAAVPPIGAVVYEDAGATAITAASPTTAWNTAVKSSSVYNAPLRPSYQVPLVPAAGTLLGALVPQTGKVAEELEWTTLETESHRPLDVAHTIYKWGLTLPTWRESFHIANGRIPMVSWGGYDTTAIVSGSQDAYIRSVATGLRDLGVPVMLRWFWEMDGNNFAPVAGTPAAFKAAWIHIHNIFASIGATNVEWVWSPTAWGFVGGNAQLFYPGASYVDWISADGFDSAPLLGGAPQSFVTIFAPFYTWASAQGKPVMIAATGTVEGATGSVKSDWIKGMGRAIQKLFPDVAALVYFNAAAPTYTDPDHIYDWRVDSTVSSLGAWVSIATEKYFRHNG